jgi:cation diffusion facilitator family transporter
MQEISQEKRNRKGKVASLIGIIVNLLLAGGKITLGVITGAISVLADGLNNLTDCGSSVISNISFRLSSRPADKEHPYGHERIEYVCSMAVAFIILLVAFETAKESITKIISPETLNFSIIAIVVLGCSVLAKIGLFLYYKRTAKLIDSDILKAASIDSLTDGISTSVVIITLIVSKFTSFNIDGYAGVLVALFIAYSAIGILREIFSKLIGQAPDAELVAKIKDKINSYPNVLGVHDLSVYSYGPNKYFASAHIEVDANVDVLVSHELVDAIEKDFAESTNIILTGHLDPIVTDDIRVIKLKQKVETIVKNLNENFSVHDFRMVFGENNTNVLFDVAVPYENFGDKENIKADLERIVKQIDSKYTAVITIEPSI